MTKIVAAAIMRNGEIVTGKRHSDCIHEVVARGWARPIKQMEQGFVDENGKYYDRYEANKLAIESGQLDPSKADGPLISEDLW